MGMRREKDGKYRLEYNNPLQNYSSCETKPPLKVGSGDEMGER
jgi:hypothetical protein